jgi:hypothetical protein
MQRAAIMQLLQRGVPKLTTHIHWLISESQRKGVLAKVPVSTISGKILPTFIAYSKQTLKLMGLYWYISFISSESAAPMTSVQTQNFMERLVRHTKQPAGQKLRRTSEIFLCEISHLPNTFFIFPLLKDNYRKILFRCLLFATFW